jgi:hypothetical protein
MSERVVVQQDTIQVVSVGVQGPPGPPSLSPDGIITVEGDLIRGGSGGTPERLPIGATDDLPTIVDGQVIWQSRERVNLRSHLTLDGSNQATAFQALADSLSAGTQMVLDYGANLGIGAQVTWSGKRLDLVGVGEALLTETSALTVPIIKATDAAKSTIGGFRVVGAETNFIGTVNPQRFALELESSDEVRVIDLRIGGKSRGVIFDRCNRMRVSGLAVTGLIHATQLNGSIDAAVTTITVDSTTGFETAGSFRIEDEIITYTGKTGTTFTGCTRGGSAAAHADNTVVVEYFANVNYHTTCVVDGCSDSIFDGLIGYNIGSVYVHGTVNGVPTGNVVLGLRGHNIYDNGVYLDGGFGTDIIAPFIRNDTGHRNGSSAVKLRHSRNRVIGGGCTGTTIGVSVTGIADANDAYGASGYGSIVDGFVAYACRGSGFFADLTTATETDSPFRDVIFHGCQAIACCARGAASDHSFRLVGTIGGKLDACKVVDHAGSTSSYAIAISGQASPARLNKRNVLSDCEVVWPDSGAPATISVLVSYADDTQINNLTLVNTAAVGVHIVNANRTKVRGTNGINLATSSVTVNPSAASAVDTVVEMFEGMTWVDSGVTTRVIWMGKRVHVVTAAYTLTSTNYDGIETIEAGGAGAAFTITLPLIARSRGRRLIVKRTHATNNITVDGSGAETIDGAANKRLDTQYACVELIGGATEWHLISKDGTIT